MDKFFYECNDCGRTYDDSQAIYLCPECEKKQQPGQPPLGVLKTCYDYGLLSSRETGNALYDRLLKNRFQEILPIETNKSRPNLKIGKTPLYRVTRIERAPLEHWLSLKDDSQNPTFSFKDRASEIVSSVARERGFRTIVAASTGNAGSSLAGICAANGQRAIIFVPASAPVAKLTQIMMYGADIVPVDGNYDQAYDLSIEATRRFGWYNRNTAFNPFTIEGKKTVALELYGQLGYRCPDFVFVPVGDGVVLSGVFKGFEELLYLGIIEKMPAIVAIQAEGSDNIVRNFRNADFISKPSKTLADSIAVDIPRNYYMARKYMLKHQGHAMTVTDAEIVAASGLLSRNTGLFAEPAAATAFAGYLHYSNTGKIHQGAHCVVLLTGSGLKDLNAVKQIVRLPEPIKPDPEEIDRLFS